MICTVVLHKYYKTILCCHCFVSKFLFIFVIKPAITVTIDNAIPLCADSIFDLHNCMFTAMIIQLKTNKLTKQNRPQPDYEKVRHFYIFLLENIHTP